MVRAFIFTAVIAICTWAASDQAEAFHGHRSRCGGYGYAAPVTAYYAPSTYRGYYGGGAVYTSGYRGYDDGGYSNPGYGYGYGDYSNPGYGYGYGGYSNPGYGYGYGGYGANPYGSGYRGGGLSIGIGSGLRYGGYGGYGGSGYGFGW